MLPPIFHLLDIIVKITGLVNQILCFFRLRVGNFFNNELLTRIKFMYFFYIARVVFTFIILGMAFVWPKMSAFLMSILY